MATPARKPATSAAIVGPADSRELTDARAFALAAARIVADNRCEAVSVIDLRGLSALADYFVIATGTSERQMHAVADLVIAHAKAVGRRPFSPVDTRSSTWVLADFVDVVIHLFDRDHREYYDLDGLWGDAPRIDIATGKAG